MRTYELRGKGVDTLTLVSRPVPRPGPGQVLVRMHATSLNYRDLLVATGRYGRGEMHYPLVPVSDGAGEVVDVGPNVTRLKPKDRVAQGQGVDKLLEVGGASTLPVSLGAVREGGHLVLVGLSHGEGGRSRRSAQKRSRRAGRLRLRG
jgi:NADPH:quinone reductase-like Zn-dependent oxidoreductase